MKAPMIPDNSYLPPRLSSIRKWIWLGSAVLAAALLIVVGFREKTRLPLFNSRFAAAAANGGLQTKQPNTEKMKIALNQLLDGYEHHLVDAINTNNFNLVQPDLTPGSSLYAAQKQLVSKLSGQNLQEKLGNFRLVNLNPLPDSSSYQLHVLETVFITQADNSVKPEAFNWVYTAKYANGHYSLADLTKWDASSQNQQVTNLFPVMEQGKYGYIDQTGKLIIPLQYQYAEDFHEGFSVVEQAGKFGYMNSSGQVVIDPQYTSATAFNDGIAQVITGQTHLFIDQLGQTVLQGVNTSDTFSEGLAPFRSGNKYGFIDSFGNAIISPAFDYVYGFSDGLAAVRIGQQYGFIDYSGALVVPTQYDMASSFHDNKAAVKTNGKYGYIDRTGKFVIQPQFMGAQQFDNGLAVVQMNQNYGVINAAGSYVLEPSSSKAPAVNHGFIYVQTDAGSQVLNAQGQAVVQIPAGKIDWFNGQLAKVNADNRFSFVDASGKTLWQQNNDLQLPQGIKLTERKDKINQPSQVAYYPEISGLPNADVQNKINQLFKSTALLRQAEPNLVDYTSDYQVPFYKGKLLNVVFNNYVFSGGAHGMPDKQSQVVNLTNGDSYKLGDLFLPDSNYVQKLSDMIKQQDVDHKLDVFSSFQSIKSDEDFYLSDNLLVIYFHPYQYTPYVSGFPEFRIPFSSIMDIINTKGSLWQAMIE